MKLTKQCKLVDEFGAVQAQLAAFAATIKPLREREKELRDEILMTVADLPDDEACGIDGDAYVITITERRIERTIKSMKRVFAVLGEKLFLARCTFPLKALKEELLPDAMAKLVTEAATGPREVIAAPRVAQAQRKAA